MYGTEDTSADQHAHTIGKIAEEAVKDSVKLTIEAVFLALRAKKDRINVSMSTPQDAVRNVKEAMKMGAGPKILKQVVNAHGPAQRLAQTNPQGLENHQNTVIKQAETEYRREQQGLSPQQEQKQEQAQEQSQGLGF